MNSYKTADLCKAAGLGPKVPCASLLNYTSYELRLWARASQMSVTAEANSKMQLSVMLGTFAPTGDASTQSISRCRC
jgi:hypothetical protein